MQETRRLYNKYQFEMLSIIIGAMGYVQKELKGNLEKLKFHKKETHNITKTLHTISVSGNVKNVKTLMGYKM